MADQFDNSSAEGIETYPNEPDRLRKVTMWLATVCSIPNDTHGNIHPQDGLFQDHQSLPGYVKLRQVLPGE